MEIVITALVTVFVLAALLYLLVLVGAVWASLYPIRIHQFMSPGMMGFDQTSFEVKTQDDVAIRGWVTKGTGDLVVVCAHGYLVNRCQWVPVAQQLVPQGATMVFFDHRGHGQSGKAKVTLGRDERMDVLAVLEYVSAEFQDKKIMLLGSSMGGVASVLAARDFGDKVNAMVLDAPFRSMKEASDAWWFFLAGEGVAKVMRPTAWIGPWLLGFKPEEVRVDHALTEISSDVPVLFFFGGADPIVPPKSAKVLEESVQGPVKSIMFEGATHGAGCFNNPKRFRDELNEFIRRHDLL